MRKDPRVATTKNGDIEACLPHPVYAGHLRLVLDRRTGNVVAINFNKERYTNEFRWLANAARVYTGA